MSASKDTSGEKQETAGESRAVKRARLVEELAKLDQEEVQTKEERISSAMRNFFQKDHLMLVIAAAMKTQLTFESLQMMQNVDSHLHSRLQSVRFGDAVRLCFTDARERFYECAITSSNRVEVRYNRFELRLVQDGQRFVKPLFWRGICDVPMYHELAKECRPAPSPDEQPTRFTYEMLPFDGATNALIGAHEHASFVFDSLLVSYLIEACKAFIEATATKRTGGDEYSIYSKVLAAALANVRTKAE